MKNNQSYTTCYITCHFHIFLSFTTFFFESIYPSLACVYCMPHRPYNTASSYIRMWCDKPNFFFSIVCWFFFRFNHRVLPLLKKPVNRDIQKSLMYERGTEIDNKCTVVPLLYILRFCFILFQYFFLVVFLNWIRFEFVLREYFNSVCREQS